MVDISIGTAGLVALLGYCTVFFGLILLMCVVIIMGAIMKRAKASADEKAKNASGVVNLGEVNAPVGSDYKKIAAITAAIAAAQRQRR